MTTVSPWVILLLVLQNNPHYQNHMSMIYVVNAWLTLIKETSRGYQVSNKLMGIGY